MFSSVWKALAQLNREREEKKEEAIEKTKAFHNL